MFSIFVIRTQLVLIFLEQNGSKIEKIICSFSYESMKCTCLKCINYFCIWCYVLENDENVTGLKAGTSVL